MQILSERSVIKLHGNDSSKFLQGLITNDIEKASTDNLIYSLFLTPQGRILSDFFIQKKENAYLLDIPKSQKSSLLAKFKIYKLKSDVFFEDLDEVFGVFVSNEQLIDMKLDPRSENFGYRGFKEISSEQSNEVNYHIERIKASIPDFDMDMEVAKSLPIDYDMNELNALSFTKGCYVGQEVVAITHNRGTKRKKVYSAFCERGIFPTKGTELFINNIKIGEALGSHGNVGLLLLNIEEVAKLENIIKNELFTLRITNA